MYPGVHSLAIVSTSRVGDDVRTTRATADEVTRRFHRQATCDSLTYATDIAIPTVSDYEDFTMPTKPDITTLKVKSTDKM